MDFFGHDSGVVCTAHDGITSLTLNGGIMWKGSPMQLSVADINGSLYGRNSCFLDVNHIWFCNGSTLSHTSNAGQTWVLDTNQASLAQGNSIQCIYFLDSLTGFEGGQGYSLFRTSDGGKNWSLVYDSASEDGSVYQIKFCTPKLGLAVSGQYLSYVLRTTDGGMNWTNDTVGGSFTPTGLSYPDPHNAWYTDLGWLYHSSDSGLTWTTVINNPLGQGFRSSCFLDSIHGIATGGDPDTLKIGYTSNGGISWQTTTIDSEGSYETFTSFPDSNTAYVGGYDAVYKLNFGDLAVQAVPVANVNVRIFPNPASSSVTITSAEAGSTVHLLDILGREVLHGTVPAIGSFTLDVSSLPRGLYYISDGITRSKFLKE
jgi:photosystem II stability/assembly factor-like uncharacterized protein